MRKYILIPIVLIAFFSCSTENNTEKEKESDAKEVIEVSIIKEPKKKTNINKRETFDFISPIRPEETKLGVGVQYIDRLMFIEFNDDYDYGFSLFTTEKGDTVRLLHNDPIDNSNKGSLMKILWEIGTFYEAGEGEQKYFKESLISYEIIKK